MQRIIIYWSAVFIVIFSLAVGLLYNKHETNRVEQETVRCVGFCPSGTCLTTYVWYRDKIVKAWYDDIDIVNDSLIILRQKQADDLLTSLEKCR
jgi:hypothetical protein